MNRQMVGAIVGALALAVIAAMAVRDLLRVRRMRALRTFYGGQKEYREEDGPRPTEAYRIRLAFQAIGLNVQGSEQLALYGAYLLVTLVLWAVMLPFHLGLPGVLGAGVLAYYGVRGVMSSRWERVRMEMEKDIPTMLRNMSGFLQAGSSTLQVLGETVRTLDSSSPLRVWLARWTHELQLRGAQALPVMRAEAQEISGALLLAIFEIERLWETGGSGYARAFQLAAENLSELIAVRAQASAKASGAFGLARLIILTSTFTLGYMMLNPGSRAMFMESAFVKIGLVVYVAWGAFGWNVIREMVKEATE